MLYPLPAGIATIFSASMPAVIAHLPNGVPTRDNAVTEGIIHKIPMAFHRDGHMAAAHHRQMEGFRGKPG